MAPAPQIAYFSMEIALDERFSTYSGGLGILAGDTLRSAADLGLPMVAVTLAYPNGYFRQTIDANGAQHESPDTWSPAKLLKPVVSRVHVEIEGRTVRIAAWRFDVVGVNHDIVPAYLLDTDLEENAPEDRLITATLYGGDARYRLAQEIVLGIGGGRMLEALGYRSIDT
jgi:starch phosphorylase